MTTYDQAFFESLNAGALSSARAIVPILVRALSPSSVVDVGCGMGIWLSVFREEGVVDVLGLDGAYVDRRQLRIPEDRFQSADLTRPLKLDRRFDLAVSLEVAEHLPVDRSSTFVSDLVSLAPAVAFSAAIPFQGGNSHINERWQDEWARLFAQHDYRPLDLVRPTVWDDASVEPWYAQNLLVYAEDSVQAPTAAMPLRVVHPVRYARLMSPRPPLRPRALLREAARTAYATPGLLRGRRRSR